MSNLLDIIPKPPEPPEEPPYPARVAMWVSVALNALVVAGMGVAFASAHQNNNEVAMVAYVAGTIALVGVSNWLLFSVNWHKAVERAKWDAFRAYDSRVAEVNAKIEQVNKKTLEVDAMETEVSRELESQRIAAETIATGLDKCLAVANQRLLKADPPLLPVMLNRATNLPDLSAKLTEEEKKFARL